MGPEQSGVEVERSEWLSLSVETPCRPCAGYVVRLRSQRGQRRGVLT